jgi:hypothetical protein
VTVIEYGANTYGAFRYGGTTPPAPPVVYVETLIGSTWQDITCDVRAIDLSRGRSSALEAFAAGTCDITLANFHSLYSAWNPAGLWAQATPYRVGVPIRVSFDYLGTRAARFTGTTDSVDALATVHASDDMKRLARHNGGVRASVGDNELTGARINRLADDAGWTAPRSVDAGTVRVQATDLNGISVDLMRAIGETEWGWLYVRGDGTLIFRQRDAVQTQPRMMTPQYVFVDDDGYHIAGAVCYTDLKLPVDQDNVINTANVTPPGLALSSALDSASVAWFGPRTWSRTDLPFKVQADALSLCQLVVLEQKAQAMSVDGVSFRATLNEACYAAATGVQLLDRVRVIRGFPGDVFSLDADLIVEGMTHHIEADGTRTPKVWDVTLQTSTALSIAGFGQWDVGQWDTSKWGA